MAIVAVPGLSAFVGFEDLRNGAEKEEVEGSASWLLDKDMFVLLWCLQVKYK